MLCLGLILSFGAFLPETRADQCLPLAFNLRTIRYYDFLTDQIATTAEVIRQTGFDYIQNFHARQLKAFAESGCPDSQFPKTYTRKDRTQSVYDFLNTFKTKRGNLYSKDVREIVRAAETLLWQGGKNRPFATCIMTAVRDAFLKMQERCLQGTVQFQTNRMQPANVLPDILNDYNHELNIRSYVTLEMMTILAASTCENPKAVLKNVTKHSHKDLCYAVGRAYGEACSSTFKEQCPAMKDCQREFVKQLDPYLPLLLRKVLTKAQNCKNKNLDPPGAPSAQEIWNDATTYIRTLGIGFVARFADGEEAFEAEANELVDLVFHISRLGFNDDICRCTSQ